MRIPRPPRAPTELESDALLGSNGCETREKRRCALRPEFGGVVFLLVDAWVRGSFRVEVEGAPGDGEGVLGVGLSVGCDGAG